MNSKLNSKVGRYREGDYIIYSTGHDHYRGVIKKVLDKNQYEISYCINSKDLRTPIHETIIAEAHQLGDFL